MSMATEQFPFYTIEEAAYEVGVTKARIHQWIKDKVVIPHKPHSRATFLSRTQVEKLKKIPASKTGRKRISENRG